MVLNVNESKMISFRMPRALATDLKAFLAKNCIGSQHFLHAFCERVIASQQQEDISVKNQDEVDFLNRVVQRARAIEKAGMGSREREKNKEREAYTSSLG